MRPEHLIDELCLWLGGNYIDYPTAFRVRAKQPNGAFQDVPFRFGIVGQPSKPLENRLDITLEHPASGVVRLEIVRPPTESNWWWSVAELEVK